VVVADCVAVSACGEPLDRPRSFSYFEQEFDRERLLGARRAAPRTFTPIRPADAPAWLPVRQRDAQQRVVVAPGLHVRHRNR
jgi:hypothetical protein